MEVLIAKSTGKLLNMQPVASGIVLPKESFVRIVQLACLRVPREDAHFAVSVLDRKDLLGRPKTRCVVRTHGDGETSFASNAEDHRLILFGDHVKATTCIQGQTSSASFGAAPMALSGASDRSMTALRTYNERGWTVETHDLRLGWEHATVTEILRELLSKSRDFPITEAEGESSEMRSDSGGMDMLPSGFETIGHVAHVNLKARHLPHRGLIGAVILDKNYPRIRSVVNKVGEISSTFRTFDMELLAGDADLNVTVVESDCVFEFNYAECYWNSKLQQEHSRVLRLLRDDLRLWRLRKRSTPFIVVDLFAGVGPFAVPAAASGNLNLAQTGKLKRKDSKVDKNEKEGEEVLIGGSDGLHVFANDLNPSAVSAMVNAAKQAGNKIGSVLSWPAASDDRVDTSEGTEGHPSSLWNIDQADGARHRGGNGSVLWVANMDGANFVESLAQAGVRPHHIIMNLPAIALEFLPALYPWRVTSGSRYDTQEICVQAPAPDLAHPQPITVHCYLFSHAASASVVADAVEQVEGKLDIPSGTLAATGRLKYVQCVRSVAPQKSMVCVGFELPPAAVGP